VKKLNGGIKMINKIFIGDALEILQEFPDSFVDMCITSPPYYGLRDYGVQGQLGQESDFNLYIDKLLAIFDEVKRILKKKGTCWVNISDTYEDKSLLGIPFQFVQGMLNKGWILRNTIIWHKPNAMPINVKDRFTIDFEYLFFFSKNKKYYYKTNHFISVSGMIYRMKQNADIGQPRGVLLHAIDHP
jgi:site-specific DNA-methyltransferase (adenine-specific)